MVQVTGKMNSLPVVAKVAKTFGRYAAAAETPGEFRYPDCTGAGSPSHGLATTFAVATVKFLAVVLNRRFELIGTQQIMSNQTLTQGTEDLTREILFKEQHQSSLDEVGQAAGGFLFTTPVHHRER